MLEILHRLDSPFGPTYTRAAPLQVQPERRLLPVGARKSLSRRLRFAHAEPKGLKRGWGWGGSGWSWAFAVHPVGGTSTTMEIKNAGGKEPGYKSRTTASSRIPGYSRAWKTMPPSRQCALHAASMNFHENYVRIFIPFSSPPAPPLPPPRAFVCFRLSLGPDVCSYRETLRPSRASFRICLISSFFLSSSDTLFSFYSYSRDPRFEKRYDAITSIRTLG